MGNGCDSVGRVVASETRDPRFKLSYGQISFAINCIAKNVRCKKKMSGIVQFLIIQTNCKQFYLPSTALKRQK